MALVLSFICKSSTNSRFKHVTLIGYKLQEKVECFLPQKFSGQKTIVSFFIPYVDGVGIYTEMYLTVVKIIRWPRNSSYQLCESTGNRSILKSLSLKPDFARYGLISQSLLFHYFQFVSKLT
jgi:hypothetical protein